MHQYGGRVGGPIVHPGLFDGRGKAFFFFNYEEFYQPTEASRTRTILHPRAQAGMFRYNVTVGGQTQVREIDMLALAAAERADRRARSDHPQSAGADPRRGRDDRHDHAISPNPLTQQYFYQSRARDGNMPDRTAWTSTSRTITA